MTTADDIVAKCDEIKKMLLAKNEAYGDSALAPVECFVKGLTPTQRMGVRMDDKISRLMRGKDFADEDTLLDLAGYIVLMLIAREQVVPDAAEFKMAVTEESMARAKESLYRKCDDLFEHRSHYWRGDQREHFCAGH